MRCEAMTWLAILLKPLVALVLLVGVVAPLTWIASKLIPPGRVKTLLFDAQFAEKHRVAGYALPILAFVLVVVGISLYGY